MNDGKKTTQASETSGHKKSRSQSPRHRGDKSPAVATKNSVKVASIVVVPAAVTTSGAAAAAASAAPAAAAAAPAAAVSAAAALAGVPGNHPVHSDLSLEDAKDSKFALYGPCIFGSKISARSMIGRMHDEHCSEKVLREIQAGFSNPLSEKIRKMKPATLFIVWPHHSDPLWSPIVAKDPLSSTWTTESPLRKRYLLNAELVSRAFYEGSISHVMTLLPFSEVYTALCRPDEITQAGGEPMLPSALVTVLANTYPFDALNSIRLADFMSRVADQSSSSSSQTKLVLVCGFDYDEDSSPLRLNGELGRFICGASLRQTARYWGWCGANSTEQRDTERCDDKILLRRISVWKELFKYISLTSVYTNSGLTPGQWETLNVFETTSQHREAMKEGSMESTSIQSNDDAFSRRNLLISSGWSANNFRPGAHVNDAVWSAEPPCTSLPPR